MLLRKQHWGGVHFKLGVREGLTEKETFEERHDRDEGERHLEFVVGGTKHPRLKEQDAQRSRGRNLPRTTRSPLWLGQSKQGHEEDEESWSSLVGAE